MKKTGGTDYQISGRVIDSNSKRGIGGLRVEAWDKDLLTPDLVGSAVTDSNGSFRIEFTGAYYRELFFDREPDLFFRVFSGDKLIKSTEDSVLWNVKAGTTPVEIALPWTSGNHQGGDQVYYVAGVVSSPDRAGVGNLRVEIVDRNIGEDISLDETVTDDRGNYEASFTLAALRARGKELPDLQARVSLDQTFIAASEVRYNATNPVTLNVVLPAKSAALASEYETLVAAIAVYYKGPLSDLKESDDQQDITYLANKSGWDARAVALAALADQLSKQSKDAKGAPLIKPAFYYALFRAGLPANPDTLYQADAPAVEQLWKQAIEQGVIPRLLDQEIPAALAAFKKLGAEKLLTIAPAAGTSTFKEMLAVSMLPEAQHQQFVDLYTTHHTDPPEFWKAVTGAFGEETSARLQLNGKLGFLTVNNAPLISQIHHAAGENGLNDPIDLARQGFHRAENWSALLGENVSIPKEIPGNSPEKKRENYAAYLAAQVRLSYPTAAVAEMVRSGDLQVGAAPQVHSFLTEHRSFEIGAIPVEQYIARNKLTVGKETVTEVKRLQRVYQITSSDQAMAGLLKRNIDSAHQVVAHGKQAFVRTFAQDLGGEENAKAIYDRSVQVHTAVINVAVTYLTARNGIGLGATPAARRANGNGRGHILESLPAHNGNGQGEDLIAYPTLEQLFGEMDFCACDHCRSILSPAAYLVDLLLFIDQPTPPGGTNPQTVLLNRRPDIQHLPLTCENTNTALPYIDVVNETLEYFVANDVRELSLDDYVGHDTDGLASEDLLATPQFVMDSAYTILRNERFPPPLPFHQPLENLRRNFDKFEVPLPLAMERLRKSDNLERGTDPYGWRDILIEELRISRSEHEILTDSTAVPLWRMYGFPSGTTDANVIAGIPNFTALVQAKAFTRRLAITYEDLAAILRTRFVNPNSDLIPKLQRLGVSFAALKKLKDTNTAQADADFDELLPDGAGAPDPADYDGDIKAWVKNQDNFDRIMSIITLTNPVAGADPCSFDNLELRYSRPPADDTDNSNRIGAVEFVRLLRFIRLWKKLGWTIEQTDAAICALFPVSPFPLAAGAIDTFAKLDTGFSNLLPRLGVIARVMKALNLNTKRDLLPLLACWSSLGTHGDSALYRQMFLNPTLLKQNPMFADNGYGEFLQRVEVKYQHGQPTLEAAIIAAGGGKIHYDHINTLLAYSGILTTTVRDALKTAAGATLQFQQAVDALYAGQRLNTHETALRSALNLTAEEFLLIFGTLEFNAETLLSLENISAIYRYGWVARKLKLSVLEFILLVKVTGVDPFVTLSPTAPAIVKLIELVQALRARALKTAAALYLIWNQDLSGKSTPEAKQIADFARTLRSDFAAIETEFSVKDDPDGTIAQTRMTLVYGTEVATFFFGLLNDTFSIEITFTDPDGTLAPGATRTAIDAAAGNTQAGQPRITYDDFQKRLTYVGELTATTQNGLKIAAGVGNAAFKTAVDQLFAKSDAAIGPFFSRYPELRPVYTAYFASPDPIPKKRTTLLSQILPELVQRRKREQALQAISAVAQSSLSFARLLLDTSIYGNVLHAAGNTAQSALNDILALERQGLSTEFFASPTATGTTIAAPDPAATLSYSPLVAGVGNPLPANPAPGTPISGIWRGYLEAPAQGFFKLVIDSDATATVSLKLDGEVVPLTQTASRWQNTNTLELAAGQLYAIELKVENVTNNLNVQWEWDPKGQGRVTIPSRYLYPEKTLAAFRQLFLRYLKAVSLATSLRLTENELAHFASHTDYRINATTGLPDAAGDGWLNVIPNEDNLHLANPAAATVAQALNATLGNVLTELLNYATIKTEHSPDDESLLTILEDPAAATAAPDSLLFTLTRWDAVSLNDVLSHFGTTISSLSSFKAFRRAYDAFAIRDKMGISAKALIQATTNEPTGDIIRDLQAALRARYDPADWRTVVQPLNDDLRSLQRDALVAYILHKLRSNPLTAHIDTADKLFEYFLMDVEMAPCMQTSRIRHALSSVQLFIERCLMNLETEVSPAAINGKQWEWMKRYRVWEANRKVFLYPENWLEPELRDDKSPFFKEIESTLLQSDITEESAAVAILNYLSDLEEVAKLEPCGIYHVPADARTSAVDHVIARTAGANRKYYYRRRQDGSWTPWELIKLDIEDNPVLPVVWKGRLFLFWLRIFKKAPLSAPSAPASGTSLQDVDASQLIKGNEPEVSLEAILCWSEYFNGKWQPTRTSDTEYPLSLGKSKSKDFHRDELRLSVMFWTRGEARIIVSNEIGTGNSFFLHNVYSSPELREEKKNRHFAPRRIVETEGSNTLKISYPSPSRSHTLFNNALEDGSIEPYHPSPGDPWDVPFFYEDRRHVFYVTTEESLVTLTTWDGPFIISAAPPASTAFIPPLVFEEHRTLPDPLGPITRQPGFGVTDPSPMQHFITEDAHIHRGIASMGTVTFGDKEIGPTGSQIRSTRTR